MIMSQKGKGILILDVIISLLLLFLGLLLNNTTLMVAPYILLPLLIIIAILVYLLVDKPNNKHSENITPIKQEPEKIQSKQEKEEKIIPSTISIKKGNEIKQFSNEKAKPSPKKITWEQLEDEPAKIHNPSKIEILDHERDKLEKLVLENNKIVLTKNNTSDYSYEIIYFYGLNQNKTNLIMKRIKDNKERYNLIYYDDLNLEAQSQYGGKHKLEKTHHHLQSSTDLNINTSMLNSSLIDDESFKIIYISDTRPEALNGLINHIETYDTRKRNIPLSTRIKVFERDNYTCRICGRNPTDDNVKLEVDHIIPFSQGGSNKIDNLQTLCFDCNRGKSDKILKNHIHKVKK